MESTIFGSFSLLTIWCFIGHGASQYQDLQCEALGSRQARQMIRPGPECDMTQRDWCTHKTANYPEEKIMELILDNRGVMKRLFGDSREVRMIQDEMDNSDLKGENFPLQPPRRRYKSIKTEPDASNSYSQSNSKDTFESSIDTKLPSSNRHGKKIDNRTKTKGKLSDLVNDSPYLVNHRMNSLTDNTKDDKDTQHVDKDSQQSNRNSQLEDKGSQHPNRDGQLLDKRPNDKQLIAEFTNSEPLIVEALPKTTTTTKTPEPPSTTPPIQEEDTIESMTSTDTTSEYLTTTEMSDLSSASESTVVPEAIKPEEVTRKAPTRNKVRFPGSADRSETTASSQPIDSGDDLRYTHGQASPPKIKQSTGVTDKPHSTEYLKGRVQPSANAANQQPPANQRDKPRQPVYTRPQQDHQDQRYNNPPNRPKLPVQSGGNQMPDKQQFFQPQLEPPYMVEKFAACNSTTELIAPTWARNMQGKNLIVVNVGSFMQHLQVEECDKDSINRKMYCQRGCRCEQQYRYQKLLVMDPEDECRGIFSDWFRFPSCCTCICYPQVWQRTNIRGGRIYNNEQYDLYYEDEDPDLFEFDDTYEDDVNYLAVPSENHINTQPAESSIDRMYVPESKPADEEWKKAPNRLDKTEKQPQRPLMMASREKKSRLLNTNLTVNIRPQVPPRRVPPPRALTSSYQFPWSLSPKLPLWPPLSYYNQLQRSISNYRNPGHPRPINLFQQPNGYRIRSVTPSPPIERVTLGTLNTATSPFHNWKWRADSGRSLDRTEEESQEPLRRSPRSLRLRNKIKEID